MANLRQAKELIKSARSVQGTPAEGVLKRAASHFTQKEYQTLLCLAQRAKVDDSALPRLEALGAISTRQRNGEDVVSIKWLALDRMGRGE